MKMERGDWQVMRNCCTSGNCVECRGIMPLGTPARVLQADGYSKAYAEYVASNWALYKATAEKMPDAAGDGPPPYDAATATGMYDRDC